MKTAICLIVKNEEADIMEWMAFHFSVGFDTLLIYDNMSIDRTAGIVQAIMSTHDVRLISWSQPMPGAQEAAYTHALATYGSEFDWIAFVDADEFITPLRDGNIKGFLSRFEDHQAIALNWAMFGSSGHKKDPVSYIVTSFLNRAPDNFGPNRHIKTMIRPPFLEKFVNPHYARLAPGHDYVNALGKSVSWERDGLMANEPSIDICRVNHYFTRSHAHWERRLQRGQSTNRTWEEFGQYDRNEVPDKSVLPFIAPMMLELTRMQIALANVA